MKTKMRKHFFLNMCQCAFLPSTFIDEISCIILRIVLKVKLLILMTIRGQSVREKFSYIT